MTAGFSSTAIRAIHDGRVARLATTGRSGLPLVVPICYVFNGQFCYSVIDEKPKRASGNQLKRIQNIRENPSVSLLIDHYEEDWSRLAYVIIQARAEILSQGQEFREAIDLLLAKYPQYQKMSLDRETGTMIKMSPQKVIEWRVED